MNTEPLDLSDLDEDPADDLSSFMNELDRELKPEPGNRKKRATVSWNEGTFPQQWFPLQVSLFINEQHCTCGAVHRAVGGLFTVDTTRNGALRSQRCLPEAIPPSHRALPRRLQYEREVVHFCHECFSTQGD